MTFSTASKCIGSALVVAMAASAPASAAGDGMIESGQTSGANTTGAAAQGTTTPRNTTGATTRQNQSGMQSGAAATRGGTGAGQTQAGAQGGAGAPGVVFMLVPLAANNETTKSGCWARIYSGTNYTGDTLTLTGPLAIADMSGPYGLNWDDKVDSVVVGPKATLTVYDNESFRDQVAVFKGGRSVPDISRPLGFFDEFKSVRLTCAR